MSEDHFRFPFITARQTGMNSPAGLRGPGSERERLDAAIATLTVPFYGVAGNHDHHEPAQIKRHDVSHVLSGHWHQDMDVRWRGISVITSTSISMPIQYPEEASFKIVTVFSDGWSVRRVAIGAT